MSKCLALVPGVTSILLSACIITPKTVDDDLYRDCQLVTRKWDLEATVIGGGSGCVNEACVAALLALPVVSGALSGSIVLVGNSLHWLEAQGRCGRNVLAAAEREIARARLEDPTDLVDDNGQDN